jgi:hypothetical protein
MLKINFPQNVKLEIKVKDKYYKTSSNVFRSWHGPRRADGKPFTGDVYCFNSNDLYRDGFQRVKEDKRAKGKELVKRIKALPPVSIMVIKASSKGPGVLPTTKSGRPIRMSLKG